MNDNTKAAFKQTTRKSRSKMFKQSNPRNRWNTRGKVGNCKIGAKTKNDDFWAHNERA